MERPKNGFSRRSRVGAPNVPIFGHPVDLNDVRSLSNGHDPDMGSPCEYLYANRHLSARLIEGDNQAVWIGTLGSGDDRVFLTHITNDFYVPLLPNRVIEHVAPDPGRVRNQNANLFLFQRIGLRICILAKARCAHKTYRGPILVRYFFVGLKRPLVLDLASAVLVLGTEPRQEKRRGVLRVKNRRMLDGVWLKSEGEREARGQFAPRAARRRRGFHKLGEHGTILRLRFLQDAVHVVLYSLQGEIQASSDLLVR